VASYDRDTTISTHSESNWGRMVSTGMHDALHEVRVEFGLARVLVHALAASDPLLGVLREGWAGPVVRDGR
jgi:hypothetical protein